MIGKHSHTQSLMKTALTSWCLKRREKWWSRSPLRKTWHLRCFYRTTGIRRKSSGLVRKGIARVYQRSICLRISISSHPMVQPELRKTAMKKLSSVHAAIASMKWTKSWWCRTAATDFASIASKAIVSKSLLKALIVSMLLVRIKTVSWSFRAEFSSNSSARMSTQGTTVS